MANKLLLVNRIASKAGVSKAKAGEILASVLDSVVEIIAEEGEITLPGFGKFTKKTTEEKTAVIFGEKKTIKAKTVLKFKASKSLIVE